MTSIIGPDWQLIINQDTLTFMTQDSTQHFCFIQSHALYVQNTLSDESKMAIEVSNQLDRMAQMGILGRV